MYAGMYCKSTLSLSFIYLYNIAPSDCKAVAGLAGLAGLTPAVQRATLPHCGDAKYVGVNCE